MKHKIEIKKLGPIESCECEINDFTVFTGPQSNGKSTVAKAIFYFRTIKQDIYTIMQQGGPTAITDNKNARWSSILRQRLRNKFLDLFGTSWVMHPEMYMRYSFNKDVWIRIFLEENLDYYDKNFVEVEFCEKLEDYLSNLDDQIFSDLPAKDLDNKEQALARFFDDHYETVFIPAGRNLITLLSAQLNYIFTSLENAQLRNIDYITRRYTELILKIKPLFKDDYEQIVFSAENNFEQEKKYKKHKQAIRILLDRAGKILKGSYRNIDGEERLYLDQRRFVKINFASSGQQEIVWVFNLLFYYLLEDKKVFLIVEEPESHLFPDSQQGVGEILTLFANEGNQILVTTHSPYILGTFNYLLLAGQANKANEPEVKKIVRKKLWLYPDVLSAFFVSEGTLKDAIDYSDDLALIRNELIDGASRRINENSDLMIELSYSEESDEEE